MLETKVMVGLVLEQMATFGLAADSCYKTVDVGSCCFPSESEASDDASDHREEVVDEQSGLEIERSCLDAWAVVSTIVVPSFGAVAVGYEHQCLAVHPYF